MLVIPHLILRKNSQILLLKRSENQKIWPNKWHCVTGTIEYDESPKDALIRETIEEIGCIMTDLKLMTTVFVSEQDLFHYDKKFYAIELFFLYDLENDQIPINQEPHKHSAISWFDINKLPDNMIPCVEFGIKAFLQQQNYTEFRS